MRTFSEASAAGDRARHIGFGVAAVAVAALAGPFLVRITARDDGLLVLLGLVNLALSFIWYPLGLLQFLFLNVVGEQVFIRLLGVALMLRRAFDFMVFGVQPAPGLFTRPPAVVALLFVLSLNLSLLSVEDLRAGVLGILTYVQLLVLFWLLVDFLSRESRLKLVLLVIILGGAVNGGLGLYEAQLPDTARTAGFTGNANMFGLLQLLLLSLILPLVIHVKSLVIRGGLMLWLIVVALSIVTSLSRGAMVAGFAVVLWALIANPMKGKVVIGVTATLLLAAAVAFAPEGFRERIEGLPVIGTPQLRQEGSVYIRMLYITKGIEIGRDHLWTGIGIRQFSEYLGRYANLQELPAFGAHNAYVSLFAEAGIVSLGLFIALLATVFWYTGRFVRKQPESLARVIAQGAQFAIVALAVGGMFGTLEYGKVSWIVLAVASSSPWKDT